MASRPVSNLGRKLPWSPGGHLRDARPAEQRPLFGVLIGAIDSDTLVTSGVKPYRWSSASKLLALPASVAAAMSSR